jgi:hypothetical protein
MRDYVEIITVVGLFTLLFSLPGKYASSAVVKKWEGRKSAVQALDKLHIELQISQTRKVVEPPTSTNSVKKLRRLQPGEKTLYQLSKAANPYSQEI